MEIEARFHAQSQVNGETVLYLTQQGKITFVNTLSNLLLA